MVASFPDDRLVVDAGQAQHALVRDTGPFPGYHRAGRGGIHQGRPGAAVELLRRRPVRVTYRGRPRGSSRCMPSPAVSHSETAPWRRSLGRRTNGEGLFGRGERRCAGSVPDGAQALSCRASPQAVRNKRPSAGWGPYLCTWARSRAMRASGMGTEHLTGGHGV